MLRLAASARSLLAAGLADPVSSSQNGWPDSSAPGSSPEPAAFLLPDDCGAHAGSGRLRHVLVIGCHASQRPARAQRPGTRIRSKGLPSSWRAAACAPASASAGLRCSLWSLNTEPGAAKPAACFPSKRCHQLSAWPLVSFGLVCGPYCCKIVLIPWKPHFQRYKHGQGHFHSHQAVGQGDADLAAAFSRSSWLHAQAVQAQAIQDSSDSMLGFHSHCLQALLVQGRVARGRHLLGSSWWRRSWAASAAAPPHSSCREWVERSR